MEPYLHSTTRLYGVLLNYARNNVTTTGCVRSRVELTANSIYPLALNDGCGTSTLSSEVCYFYYCEMTLDIRINWMKAVTNLQEILLKL